MLAHELSHVAHRDVLVMTVASSAGIVAGMLTRGAQFGALSGGRGSNEGATGVLVALVVSLVVYADQLLPARLLSRYRELAADRAGAYLTFKPAALASALQKISGEIATIPQSDLRASKAMNAFFIAPAISGASLKTLTSTHPSLEQRLEQLARIQAELGRQRRPDGALGGGHRAATYGAGQPRRAVRGAQRGDHAADGARAAPRPAGLGLLPRRRRARRSTRPQREVVALLEARSDRAGRPHHDRLVRLHLAHRHRRPGGHRRRSAPTSTPSTPRWRPTASVPGCCARWCRSPTAAAAGSGWSTSTSRARSTRSRPPAPSSATTCWRSGARRARRGAADGEGPEPLARGVGGSGVVTTRRTRSRRTPGSSATTEEPARGDPAVARAAARRAGDRRPGAARPAGAGRPRRTPDVRADRRPHPARPRDRGPAREPLTLDRPDPPRMVRWGPEPLARRSMFGPRGSPMAAKRRQCASMQEYERLLEERPSFRTTSTGRGVRRPRRHLG